MRTKHTESRLSASLATDGFFVYGHYSRVGLLTTHSVQWNFVIMVKLLSGR